MKKAIFCGLIAVLALSACQESLEEKAVKEAVDYTKKNCPLPINEYQYLDSFTFERSTHTFGYYYKMVGAMDTAAAIQPAEMARSLKENVKNATFLKPYKDEGYSFKYVFYSEKNPDVVYYATSVTEADYR